MRIKLLLTFALLLTAVTGAFADESGSCGEVSYSYVESTHTLTISGTGAMADYPDPSERPWDSYAGEIETVIIEDGVTGIGDCAFHYCEGLTSVAIPASVTSIGVGVFYGCLGLTSVTIGSGVTSIGYDAFRSCSSLTSVTIPASVTSIGVGVFAYCSNLATMTVETGNTKYDSRNSCNAIIEKESNTLIIGCNGSTIPDDVTGIGENAFLGCDGLTTITIPASVTSIGAGAFANCSNLATMTVETGNTVYDSRNGCNAIIEKESNTLIAGCNKTIIPASVTSIGDYAFEGCIGLTTVTIPAGVTTIGKHAFESCTGMTTVTIGSGVTYIGSDAFFNCTNVEVVYCNADPEKLEWEENGCDDFKYDGSTIIKVADAAPWIAKFGDEVNGIFSDKPYVPLTWKYDAATKTLTFSGTAPIPSYNDPDDRPWKDYVAEVENIVIEDGVTSIGDKVFSYCASLTTVTIPASVTYIGSDAFYDCTKVEVVYCNADPTKLTWEESGCDDFKEDGTTIIHVADAAPWIANFTGVVNGTFIDTPYVPLTWNYDAGTKTLTFSGTVIPSYGDPDDRPWKDYFSEVENIVIEDGVTSIGSNAFGYCASLTTVTIPASVTSIGMFAFYGCSGLTTVTIPASVTSIGRYAFYHCESLTSVTVNAPNCTLGEDAFDECYQLETIYVPIDKVENYKTAENWSDYADKITAFIGGDCGAEGHETDVTWLLKGTSPNYTLTISGTGAMADYASSENQPWKDYRSSITSVIIESGVTSIGKNAFNNCTGLTSVTVDAPDCTLGNGALEGCSKLKAIYVPSDLVDHYKTAWSAYASIIMDVKEKIISQGYCGAEGHEEDVTWVLKGTSPNYTLTISGTGAMADSDQPWENYRSSITSVIIESGVTNIGDYAFSDCSGLTSVTIPSSVTSIGDYAFYYCTGLTTVTIPAGVTYIGSDAFYNCTAVTDVYCNADPEKLTWVEGDCDDFKEDGSTIIHVADAAPWYTKFGSVVHGIFRDPSTVPLTWNYDAGTKTLTFSGTEAIPSYTNPSERPWKDYFSEVENIVIEEGVRGIGNNAFQNCTSLTSVTIPASVMSIGKGAFENCTGLTTVTIPSSVTRIGYGVFAGCNQLETMTVETGNTFYDSRNSCNAIIETSTNTLIAGCKNSTIPGDVTSIGNGAFEGCESLTTVTIPASVTSIGDNAFQNCTGLTTVTIGSGVTYIGSDAFYGCTEITDVYCYADPDALTWNEGGCDDFKDGKATKCHVTNATKFNDKWSTGDVITDVNVTFEGDLVPKAETKDAGEEYWSSYYNSAAHLMADDNTTVYKATLSGTTVTLTEITDGVITAGQAVLLKKTTNDPVELTPCAIGSTDDYSGNDLEGVDAETAKESGSDYYVLSYKDSKLSFYKYSGATLGANKAFFKIPANSSREFLDILGEVTGIDGRWKMEDGRSDVYYDLNGRRVMNPTKKGVYINNGSKVVVK